MAYGLIACSCHPLKTVFVSSDSFCLITSHVICASIIDCIFNTYLRFKRIHVLYFHISDMKFPVFSLNFDTFNRNTHLEYDFKKNDNKQSKQNK